MFVYAFYPADERWRVNIAFVLLCVALFFLLYDKAPFRKQGILFACIYPFIAAWLLLGGFKTQVVLAAALLAPGVFMAIFDRENLRGQTGIIALKL